MKPGSSLDTEIARVAERLQARRDLLERDAMVLKLRVQARVLRLVRSPTLLSVGGAALLLAVWLRFRPRGKP